MSHTYATEPFPYTDNNYTANPTTNVGQVLKQWNQAGSLLENLLTLFGINYADPTNKGKAIVYVQIIINYVLALLGAIAVMIILYSFFMIFFGKGDDGVAKARKTIIWAAVALIIMWLSAYIVNYLFYIYNKGI
jgi:hypothetical protein